MKTVSPEQQIEDAVQTGLTRRSFGYAARESAYVLALAVQRVLNLTAAAEDEADACTVTLSAADVLAALWGEDA